MNVREQTALWPIAASRIVIGVLWLYALRWKLPPDFIPSAGKGLMDWLELEVEHAAFAFYGEFMSSIVIPNFTLFAWMVFLVELLVGLSLLFGSITRLGGLLGLLLSINLGVGLLEVPGEWPWSYVMLAMWQGAFMIAGAGRVFGVDGLLRKRYPSNRWLRRLT